MKTYIFGDNSNFTGETVCRKMSWDDEGSLFNELQWIADGKEEWDNVGRDVAQSLIYKYVEHTHPVPENSLSDEEIEDMNEEEIDAWEEANNEVEVCWSDEDWATCDYLLRGVELVAGYQFAS